MATFEAVRGPRRVSGRLGACAACVAFAACTFEGLGNYEVRTCPTPFGQTGTLPTGVLETTADLTFSNPSGDAPFAAYGTQGDTRVAFVSASAGANESSLPTFFGASDARPRQPAVTPIGTGYAAVAITQAVSVTSTTAMACLTGVFSFAFVGRDASGSVSQTDCERSGAALPSVAALPDEQSALVTWYEADLTTRLDPLASCAGAASAALVAAVVHDATSTAPILPSPIVLSRNSTSVRPASIAAVPRAGQHAASLLVAAPDGDAVSVWSVDANLSPGTPTSVAGLSGARSASIATDGAGSIAVVGEIGCAPQSIRLAVGTLAGGFPQTTVVALQGTTAALQPTVAWVPIEGEWVVSWISAAGGAHVLAQRFDRAGNAIGEIIDPSLPATGAVVGVDRSGEGTLFAYVPSEAAFVDFALGCN